jgi:phosphohistidine phosphatase
MELFLVRHAIAVPRSPELKDEDRPLTPDGKKRMKRVVRGLQRLEVRFDHLLNSPWLRAVQTADALMRITDGERVTTTRLAEAPRPALLRELGGGARVAVVGHEPWMSELLALLLLNDHGAASERFAFDKGGVAWLDGDPKPGRMGLRGFFPEKVLRALGKKR